MWIDELIVKLNSKVKWRVSKKITALIGLLLVIFNVNGYGFDLYVILSLMLRFKKL